ncbi:hypothetical protein AOLI_G00098570 [Acnodon oligacanthus]
MQEAVGETARSRQLWVGLQEVAGWSNRWTEWHQARGTWACSRSRFIWFCEYVAVGGYVTGAVCSTWTNPTELEKLTRTPCWTLLVLLT